MKQAETTVKVGRPRKYASNTERQAAYRERVRRQEQAADLRRQIERQKSCSHEGYVNSLHKRHKVPGYEGRCWQCQAILLFDAPVAVVDETLEDRLQQILALPDP